MGEGKPGGANGPGIGPERHPRLPSRVILRGDPCSGRLKTPPPPRAFPHCKVVRSWVFSPGYWKVNQIVAIKQGVNDFSKTPVANGHCWGGRLRGLPAETRASPRERCPRS